MSPQDKPKKKGRFALLSGFSLFKRTKEDEKRSHEEINKVLGEIERMPALLEDPSNHNDVNQGKLKMLEAGYWDNEKERGSVVRDRLSKARDKHHQMSTSSVGNLQAAEVCRKVRETNTQMQGEIQALNKRLLEIQKQKRQPIPREMQEIYTQWRRIEQQAETLKFLAQIANLKLNSSGITRRVNDTQANQLKNAFSTVNFTKFGEVRGRVSDALSLNSTPKVHLKGRE